MYLKTSFINNCVVLKAALFYYSSVLLQLNLHMNVWMPYNIKLHLVFTYLIAIVIFFSFYFWIIHFSFGP